MQRCMPSIPLLLVLLGATAAACAPPATATQRRFRVDDDRRQCRNAEFTTIQAAVAAAPPGAKIEVCPGIYSEDVVVDKPLTLRGPGSNEGYENGKGGRHDSNTSADDGMSPQAFGSPNNPDKAAILDGQFTLSHGFDLRASNISVEGFTIQRYGNGIRTSADFSGYHIRRNVLQFSNVGLYLASNGDLPSTVEWNWFNQNNRGAAGTDGMGGDGTFSPELSDARIQKNLFTRHQVAAMVFAGRTPGAISSVQVERNLLNNDAAIVLFNVTDSQIRNNVSVNPSGNGIAVGGGCTNVEIRQNTIVGAELDGILLYLDERFNDIPNTNLQIRDNYLRRNHRNGIQLVDTSNNIVERNQALENGTLLPDDTVVGDGIRLGSNATGNLITRNRANGNLVDGIHARPLATNNRIQYNQMLNNGNFDAHDESVGGGTAGTANYWVQNDCRTADPAALCEHPHPGSHGGYHGHRQRQDDHPRQERF